MAKISKKKLKRGREKEGRPSIFSPEGAIILTYTGTVDLLGAILEWFPIVEFIPDILAIPVAIWAWFRIGKMPTRKKIGRYTKRFGLVALAEVFPLLPLGVLPWLTMYVFLKLKK